MFILCFNTQTNIIFHKIFIYLFYFNIFNHLKFNLVIFIFIYIKKLCKYKFQILRPSIRPCPLIIIFDNANFP